MSAYSPGTVAVATVRGVPNVRIVRAGSNEIDGSDRWFTPNYQEVDDGNGWWPDDDEVTDVRPLVVLDLANCPEDDPHLSVADHLRSLASEGSGPCHLADWLADQIASQTRPLKPEEPIGHYAIAIADGVVWCRAAWASDRPWSRVGTDVFADWAELDVTSIEFAGVDQ